MVLKFGTEIRSLSCIKFKAKDQSDKRFTTFLEIAARSVSNFFSLYFVYLQYLIISRLVLRAGFPF